MKSAFQAIFLFLFICLPAFAARQALADPNPEQSLNSISAAIEEGDLEKFEKFVDMDIILSNGLDMLLEEFKKPENSSRTGPMLALMFSQATGQGGEAIRKLLLGEISAFIANGITSGAFAGRELKAGQGQGMLAPLFAGASLGRKEITGIGEVMMDGKDWIVPFTVRDYGNGHDYPVIGRFSEVDGLAKLVKIENMDQIFRQIQMEAESD